MVKPSAPLWTSITSTPSRSPPRRVRLEIVQLTSPGNFNSPEVMENPSKWTSRETSVSIQLFVAMIHDPIKKGTVTTIPQLIGLVKPQLRVVVTGKAWSSPASLKEFVIYHLSFGRHFSQ